MCEHAHLQREEPTEPSPLYIQLGSRASLRALEALGIFLMLSFAICAYRRWSRGGGGAGGQKFGQNSGRIRVNFGRRFGQNVERKKKRQIKVRQIHWKRNEN